MDNHELLFLCEHFEGAKAELPFVHSLVHRTVGRLKAPVLSIHLGTDAYLKSQYLNSCSRSVAYPVQRRSAFGSIRFGIQICTRVIVDESVFIEFLIQRFYDSNYFRVGFLRLILKFKIFRA